MRVCDECYDAMFKSRVTTNSSPAKDKLPGEVALSVNGGSLYLVWSWVLYQVMLVGEGGEAFGIYKSCIR